MKKSILFLAMISWFIACQPKSSTPAEETTSTEPSPKVADESPVPYFNGSGNEPGWYIDIKQAQDGSFPVTLVHHYGEDTLTGNFAKPSTADAKSQFTGNLMLRGKPVAVEALISSEKCADDMSGAESTAKLDIKVDGQSFHGCGSFAK